MSGFWVNLSAESSRELAIGDLCLGREVSPLLRELIRHIVGLGMLEAEVPGHAALLEVTVGQIAKAPRLPTRLPLPQDPRGRSAAERLLAGLAEPLGLAELAKASGASARTLQRLFLEETGLGLAAWRQRARLAHAAGLLAQRVPVTAAALEAGYASTSAFTAAFRRAFGRTPTQFRGEKRSKNADPALPPGAFA